MRLHQFRFTRGPMILTSNQSIAARGDVFGDQATAILDLLVSRGNAQDSWQVRIGLKRS
jgi:hypothetical protein